MDGSDLEPLAVVSSSTLSVRLRSSDRHTPVEVVIQRKAIDDYFRLSSSTAQERLDIVEANLDVIALIVAERYRRRNFSTVQRIGKWFLEIVIESADLSGAHLKLADKR